MQGSGYLDHVVTRTPQPATLRPCFAIGQQADEAAPPGRMGNRSEPTSPLGAGTLNTALPAFLQACTAIGASEKHPSVSFHRCGAEVGRKGTEVGRSGAMRD